MTLSDMRPPHALETKLTAPEGMMPIKSLMVG